MVTYYVYPIYGDLMQCNGEKLMEHVNIMFGGKPCEKPCEKPCDLGVPYFQTHRKANIG